VAPAEVRPSLLLTRQLAAVARALLAEREARAIDRVEVTPGEALAGARDAILAAAALGVLSPVLSHERLNLINARALAVARGIALSATEGARPENGAAAYTLTVRVSSGAEEITVTGSAHPAAAPRITRIGAFPVNVYPRGTLLILSNRDVPGVIGHVGTVLGAAQVNIAEYHQARLAQGGAALAAITVDGPVPDSVRSALLALSDVHAVTVVELPSD
jgi:D-3-phosphoglycerate dehydrogenase / 2-oxoglutarate reductase